jgi:molybdopterin-guanine dinucleotide biosynthesis adapter protein
MVPIISIVGRSNTGKTTLLEGLLPVLTGRGYRVATVKHDVHGFEMDKEGKDTWRHKRAGAVTTIINSARKLGLVTDTSRELTLDEVCQLYVRHADLLITEGYKRQDKPKIEVSLNPADGLLCGEEDHLIAVVTGAPLTSAVPSFRPDEVEKLADFIEARFLKKSRSPALELYVDGKPVRLKGFVQNIMARAIRGMVSALRGCEGAGTLELRLPAAGTDVPVEDEGEEQA